MKKIQEHLKNLGFYSGPIDGVAGEGTVNGLYKALGIAKEETSHFARNEFRCTCGGRYCNGFPVEPHKNLIAALEEIRRENGNRPVHINSGIRCTKRNVEVGGVRNSYHLQGLAADLHINGVSAKTIISKIGTRYIETYAIDRDSVHIAVNK